MTTTILLGGVEGKVALAISEFYLKTYGELFTAWDLVAHSNHDIDIDEVEDALERFEHKYDLIENYGKYDHEADGEYHLTDAGERLIFT